MQILYPFLNCYFDKYLLGDVFLRLTEFVRICLDFGYPSITLGKLQPASAKFNMISREFTIFSDKKKIRVEATPVMCTFSVTVLTNLTAELAHIIMPKSYLPPVIITFISRGAS